MKFRELNKTDKLFLTTDDIANILSIDKDSAKVTAARYFQKEYLIRIKRNLYITENKFENLSGDEVFRIANIIQVPSYISLTTALGYYNITSQKQRDFIESIAVKRTKNIGIRHFQFVFTKVKKDFYTGFQFKDNYFIAFPEKAIADAVYLSSVQKYNCDFPSVDFKKLNRQKIEKYLRLTNKKTLIFWENLCKTYKI